MDQERKNSCSMTGLLGILIQLGLGFLSFSVLIIKRFRQKPKRPWRIWIMDTSKQIISQVLAHFINLTISIALAYEDKNADECLWYFMTNILDNTVGLAFCVLSLKLIQKSLKIRRKNQYISGNYYVKIKINSSTYTQKEEQIYPRKKKQQNMIGMDKDQSFAKKFDGEENDKNISNQNASKVSSIKNELVEENENKFQAFQIQNSTLTTSKTNSHYIINYKSWIVQLLIWISIVVMAKGILFGLEFSLRQPLKMFSFFIMGWIQTYPILELIVVIVIVPVVMNAFSFWMQDNFLMKRQSIQQIDKSLVGCQNKVEVKSELLR